MLGQEVGSAIWISRSSSRKGNCQFALLVDDQIERTRRVEIENDFARRHQSV